MPRNAPMAVSSRRIVLGDDHVDLLRQRPHRFVEADQAFRGLEVLQRFAHIAQAPLEAGNRAHIDAALAAVLDALRQRFDLDLERFHGAARQRFRDQARDVGEIATDRRDRAFEVGRRPKRFDPRRDLP
jgi:hypothetical protein